jgi:hypothetical protein
MRDLPSKNLRVGNALAPGDHHVHLARQIGRNLALAASQRHECRLALVNEGAEARTSWLSWVGENKALARLNANSATGKCDGWESLDVEVAALRARLNERSGERENCARTKSGIEGVGNWDCARSSADECLMASLNSEDRTSSAQDSLLLDERSSAEVSRDTDGLEDAGSADHVLGSVEVEVVLAWLNWLRSGLRDGSHKLGNMSSFSTTNSLQSGDLCWVETERSEVRVWESCEALSIEVGFEVLEGESAVLSSVSVCPSLEGMTYNCRISVSVKAGWPG